MEFHMLVFFVLFFFFGSLSLSFWFWLNCPFAIHLRKIHLRDLWIEMFASNLFGKSDSLKCNLVSFHSFGYSNARHINYYDERRRRWRRHTRSEREYLETLLKMLVNTLKPHVEWPNVCACMLEMNVRIRRIGI